MTGQELLETLASQKVLTAMITPAVLISACGTLIFSTSGRLGRLYDRLNNLKSELDGVIAGSVPLSDERIAYAGEQLKLQRRRGVLIQRALAALYSATLLFIGSSLTVAISVAIGHIAWLATIFGIAGGLFLFVAGALLLFESRYNFTFIDRHIDFISSLKEHAAGRGPKQG